MTSENLLHFKCKIWALYRAMTKMVWWVLQKGKRAVGKIKSFYFILNEHHTTSSDVIVFTRDAIISACILLAFICTRVQSGVESSSKLYSQSQTWIIWGLNMEFRERSLRLRPLLTSRKSFRPSGPIIEHNPTLPASHRWPCRSPLVSIICVITCVCLVCIQTYWLQLRLLLC